MPGPCSGPVEPAGGQRIEEEIKGWTEWKEMDDKGMAEFHGE